MGYRKYLAIFVTVVMLLAMFPAMGFAEENGNGECDDCVILFAGQDIPVGTVCVSNDGEYLYVKYCIDDENWDDGVGWGLYETHVHVGESLANFPLNRGGNPQIGLFDYKATHDGVQCYTEVIPLDGLSGSIMIAAHAVIEKTECELIAEAPYTAYKVVESDQGVRKDKSAVRAGRSDPDAVLSYDLGQDETNFFSLGFKFDAVGNALSEGGWIIVEFDCPIKNGEGNDIMVVEDTWGHYPLESADVYASQDGDKWVKLGTANNTERTVNSIHTESYFDLNDVDMDWAKFIKVVDTTPIDAMPADGDGYDLNTIVALHDCSVCKTYDETAWGDGTRFVEQGNWATYFCYTVKECEPVLLDTVRVTPFGTGEYIPTPTYSNITLETGKSYQIVAKGTYRFANWGEYGIADAAWNYRSAAYAPNGVAGWYQQSSTNLQVWIDGAAVAWEPPTFNPEHIYTFNVTGNDSTLMFTIMDNYYSDNSGYITVEIWGCPAP